MKITNILFWSLCGYYVIYLLAILFLMAFEIPATSIVYVIWGTFNSLFVLVTISYLLWNYWYAQSQDLRKLAVTSLVIAFVIFAVEFAFQTSIQSFAYGDLFLVIASMVVTVATGYMTVYNKENKEN